MHGAAVVVGVGESPYYKRGGAPETEFQLACIAIRNAVADAGLDDAPTSTGSSSYMERNEPVRLSAALGTGDLALHRADVRRRRQRRGRGGHARRRGDHRRLRRVRRRRSARSPRASSHRYGQAGRARRSRGAGAFTAPYGMLDAGADLRDADDAVHARPRRHPGQPRRGRAGLLRPRPAQPAGDPLRHAADPRGVPRVAVDRRAVPPLRLLPGERRRGGHRRHDRRAGPRPAPSRRWRSSPAPTGSSTATASPRSARRTSRPPTTATSGGSCGSAPA